MKAIRLSRVDRDGAADWMNIVTSVLLMLSERVLRLTNDASASLQPAEREVQLLVAHVLEDDIDEFLGDFAKVGPEMWIRKAVGS